MIIRHFKRRSLQSLIITLLFTLLFAAPDVIYHLLTNNWKNSVLSYLTCTAVFAFPIIIFKRNVKLYLLLLLPFGLLSLVSICCVILYNVNLNFDVFLLFLNTSFREATELIKNYYFQILFALVAFFVVYFFLLKRSVSEVDTKKAIIISLSAILILLATPLFRQNQAGYVEQIKINIAEFFPGSIYYAAKIVRDQRKIIKDFPIQTRNFLFHAQSDSTISTKQIHVMVIGETARFDHWNINGYSRPTSPKLQKRGKQLVSFTNVVSGGYLTEYSVPMLITRATPDDFARHFREKSIVSLFKETGFKTYWITNQFDYGNITIHAQEADEYIPLSTMYTATKNIHRDMELTGLLNNILQKKEQKVFVVIHTLGSHYDYDARYPDSYSRFQPTAKEVNANPTDASKKVPLTNSYDNSILYTDAVLDSVITIVSKQNAVSSISYTSDHGEELFDDSRNLSQHGFPVPSRYVAHVPWFIWTSNKFAETFPQKVQNLNTNRNVPLGSANVFYTLADLGNIKFYGDDESKSVANDEVSPQRQKILGGNGRVYDAETLAGETAQK